MTQKFECLQHLDMKLANCSTLFNTQSSLSIADFAGRWSFEGNSTPCYHLYPLELFKFMLLNNRPTTDAH